MVILGSSGMLGQALIRSAQSKNIEVLGVARSNADINLDILNFNTLILFLRKCKPKVIINCIAITDLSFCEDNIESAYLVNTNFVSQLVNICRDLDIYLIHISTDHYFIGDGRKKHDETSNVFLVNNYAKTKFAGEQFALSYPNSLVIRTNILGFRNRGKLTFVEWVLLCISENNEIRVFDDFYTSGIDVYNLAEIVLSSLKSPIFGLFNIASTEVYSKAEFIKNLSKLYNYNNVNFITESVFSIPGVRRAESLGLDIKKIESIQSIKMPSLDDVLISLYNNKD